MATIQMMDPSKVIKFGGDTTYLKWEASGTAYIYANGGKSVQLTSPGADSTGVLHGTWLSDAMVSSSDIRLKKNIRPVVDTLRGTRSLSEPGWNAENEPAGAVTEWLLRQLRPVAYNYRSALAGKDTRFGFIADEMHGALPQIVRKNTAGDSTMSGIIYEDLIAVLTYTLQDIGDRIMAAAPRLKDIEARIEKRKMWKAAKRAKARAETMV